MRLIDTDAIVYETNKALIRTGEGFIRECDIKREPTIEAEPIKHGHWWHYEGTLTCSECHTEIYDDIMELLGDAVPRYCPDCGAKMDEVEE